MKLIVLVILIVLALAGAGLYYFGRSIWVPVSQKVVGKRTVADAVQQFAPAAEQRLAPYFNEAGIAYPPTKITLIGLKEEKRLELWAENDGRWIRVKTYEVQRASGKAGPKLVEGDEQVPEGFYKIEGLNPNSSYHLSLKVNYPNEFDLAQAKIDNRSRLGGDIFIHGKAVSIGCLAMGDEAIEELFVLADRVGKNNISVIIAPYDFRSRRPVNDGMEEWVSVLYHNIAEELNKFKNQ